MFHSIKATLRKPFVIFLLAIALGVLSGCYGTPQIQAFAAFISDVFIRIFKLLSAPIIALSLIVTLSSFDSGHMSRVWKKTVLYTLTTTVLAALTAMVLYLLISPANSIQTGHTPDVIAQNGTYLQHIAAIVPNSFFEPFMNNNVMGILMLGIAVGIAIRLIPDDKARNTTKSFFKGLYSVLFVITKWVVRVLPIGIFGFVSVSVVQYMQGVEVHGIGQYFAVILLANFIQGLVVLPVWLKMKGLQPFTAMRKMMPALSVAFFSKSSTGTLPMTIETAEKRLGIQSKISRFVLPLCTTVNMNGCAAFIFTTVVFVMQNNGIDISLSTMLLWVIISTIAAAGNAGVPMGCFFLSASLLASMNIPIVLLGIILPFYGVIDMIETALNVWSDSCVANVVNKECATEAVSLPLTDLATEQV